MENMLLAIVDDDPGIIDLVSDYFSRKGATVKGFSDSEGLFRFLGNKKPDLLILDLGLPGMNGFEICKRLKEKERFSAIPIIILSGKDEERDKVSGLDLGADDYVVKPFSLEELEARIRAVLRRRFPEEEEKKIRVGEVMVIDFQTYQVTVDGIDAGLTPTEFKILELLASRKGQVFTRDRILDYLWGEEKVVIERTIDVHIRHLREKLGKAEKFIKNVRGIGYKLDEDA
ncbi:MAG: response regulator transcription factor [Candidatus Omnitrophota bacterium]